MPAAVLRDTLASAAWPKPTNTGSKLPVKSYQRDGLRPLVQQGAYVCVLQHTIGPLGGGQCIVAHPAAHGGGGAKPLFAVVDAACFALCFAAFFFLCFGAVCFSAGFGVACFAAGLADGSTAASPAQAGTTIKANKNSNQFFMFTLPLWLKNIMPI